MPMPSRVSVVTGAGYRLLRPSENADAQPRQCGHKRRVSLHAFFVSGSEVAGINCRLEGPGVSLLQRRRRRRHFRGPPAAPWVRPKPKRLIAQFCVNSPIGSYFGERCFTVPPPDRRKPTQTESACATKKKCAGCG